MKSFQASQGFSSGEYACNAGATGDMGLIPASGKISW